MTYRYSVWRSGYPTGRPWHVTRITHGPHKATRTHLGAFSRHDYAIHYATQMAHKRGAAIWLGSKSTTDSTTTPRF